MKLLHGDCLETMRGMPDASVTAIVTDPPYALEFMGKGWDKVLPDTDVWRECLRVLKPGGMLLAFGGTRTFHRLTCAIEDAGFQIRDCLAWMYGSGFPKSLDISKAIDKSEGLERESVGQRVYGDGHVQRSRKSIGFGGCDPEVDRRQETLPASERSAAWQGYGTALKPAWEPIILAMKPTDGTFAQNATTHGVAGINVDGCRVGDNAGWSYPKGRGGKGCFGKDSLGKNLDVPMQATAGRWPGNVVLDALPDDCPECGLPLHDPDASEGGWDPEREECAACGCSLPEPASRVLDEQTGEMKDGVAVKRNTPKGKVTGRIFRLGNTGVDKTYGGRGGGSRFFYCAKASKRDRGEGNNHPTVKPTELMRWLVRMVKMPSGTIVLDPFMGSGTTGVACRLEDVDFVGIEREAEYLEIARRRIE